MDRSWVDTAAFFTTGFHSWVSYALFFLMSMGLIVGGTLLVTMKKILNNRLKKEEGLQQEYVTNDESNINEIQLLQRDRGFEMVNIMKSTSGGTKIGICLEGGVDNPVIRGDPGIFVRRVKQNSPAENRLFVGDRILTINGEDVTRVTLRYAENAMRQTKGLVELYVKRLHPGQRFTKINEANDECQIYRKSEFSQQQLEELEGGFSVYDKASDGRIKSSSVMPLVRSLGYNLHEVEMREHMNELGLTAHPTIKLQDFITLMHVIVREHSSYEDDIEKAYSVFEDDDGGFLTVDKLKMALERMPGRDKVKQSEINEIITTMGLNDGKIDLNGFKRLVMPTMKLY